MYISDNNNFAALQHGQENHPVFAFSLWYLAPRSLALEVFKLPILLLLQLPQNPSGAVWAEVTEATQTPWHD